MMKIHIFIYIKVKFATVKTTIKESNIILLNSSLFFINFINLSVLLRF
jgi:hypothetical protein